MAASRHEGMGCAQDVTGMRRFLVAFVTCLWICGAAWFLCCGTGWNWGSRGSRRSGRGKGEGARAGGSSPRTSERLSLGLMRKERAAGWCSQMSGAFGLGYLRI